MRNKIKTLESKNDIVDEFIEIDDILTMKNNVIGMNIPMLNKEVAIDNKTLNT